MSSKKGTPVMRHTQGRVTEMEAFGKVTWITSAFADRYLDA